MKAERLKGNEYLKAKMHLWGGSGYVFLNHMYYSGCTSFLEKKSPISLGEHFQQVIYNHYTNPLGPYCMLACCKYSTSTTKMDYGILDVFDRTIFLKHTF